MLKAAKADAITGVARIFDWGGGGAKQKSHAVTSSEIFERETFCGTSIS